MRFALIGGGGISHKHIEAATSGGRAKLVAGCFSRDAGKNAAFARQYAVSEDRTYNNYLEMIKNEAVKPDRPDFVIVTTTNKDHYIICKALIEHGFPVACEKPLTVGTAGALELAALARKKELPCMTTYTFLGVPAIHVMKKLYEEGRIGQAYFLNMQFLHGARLQEVMNDPRSVWRFNADESGKAGTVGDLGTHLESIARFLFGAMSSVLARLLCEPNGIELDSVNNVLFKVEGGLCGSMQIAQLACGHNTDMAFEIWGDKGTLAWSYKKPDEIRLYCLGAEDKVILASDMICNNDLINLANPEIKEGVDSHTAAFRRIYEGYITAVNADPEQAPFFPDFDLGAAGVEFVDACLESQKNGNTWITLK